jgi:putative ABC transport system ATP-binding protein
MEQALVVEDLSRRYTAPGGELTVLSGISFTLAPGESLAVVGPSGSGKSTLLNGIAGLDRIDGGRVLVAGADVHALDAAARARLRAERLGFVFQEHHLLPHLDAEENVLMAALALGRAQADAAAPRARALLERLGLGARLDHRPQALSGGERQRVAVARALVNRPALLLCDEPTGSLDRASAATVADELFALAREEGAALVIATHDPALAQRCARRLELAR